MEEVVEEVVLADEVMVVGGVMLVKKVEEMVFLEL